MDVVWKLLLAVPSSTWNWIFVAAFIVMAICFWLYFFRVLSNKRSFLDDTQKKLEKYNADNIHFNFEAFRNEMEKDTLIGPMWKKYVKTLVKDMHGDSIRVYSTVDAADYFNISSLTSGINIGYWSGFAGVFTGVGILGTFIGLTVGLASVDTSSTNALSTSISSLLGGMSTAFFTSLIGIIGALLGGFLYNHEMNQFSLEVEAFSDCLDSIFTRKNIEEIMLDQVAESRAQRTAIEHLSTDIADAICNQLPDVLGQIADRVNESLHGNIAAAVNGLLEKLQEQTNELKAQSEDLQNQNVQLEKIVTNTNSLNSDVFDQFGKTINAGAGEEAKKVGNSLQKLSEDISRLSDNIATMIQKSQDTSAKVNESMLHSVETALNKLDKTMDGIMNKQNKAIEDGLAKQSQKTDENIQKMTDLMEAMKQTMQSIFEKMAEATQEQGDNIQQATNDIKESTKENLNHINNTVKDLMAEIAQRMKEMQDMLETHERHFENTLSEMKDAVADSGKVLDKAKDTAEKWNNMADSSSSKLESAATSAAGMIEASATPFKQAVQPLQQATASMDGSLKTLGVALEEYNQKTKKTLEHMQSMVENSQLTAAEIHEALEVTKKSWMAYQEQFQGVNKGMTAIFENLERGLEAYNKTTNEGMLEKLKMFDKKVGGIVDNLLTAYQESNDLLDDLNRNTKHMR